MSTTADRCVASTSPAQTSKLRVHNSGGVEELDKRSPHNWLDDNIWLRKAYHEWRAPLIVNSNWWLALGDDPSVPSAVRHPAHQTSGFTSWQVRRAAWLVHRVLDFKAQLDR